MSISNILGARIPSTIVTDKQQVALAKLDQGIYFVSLCEKGEVISTTKLVIHRN